MEDGYKLLIALSIGLIGGFIPKSLQYLKYRKAEKESYKACERHEKPTNDLVKILKDKDKNIKF